MRKEDKIKKLIDLRELLEIEYNSRRLKGEDINKLREELELKYKKEMSKII